MNTPEPTAGEIRHEHQELKRELSEIDAQTREPRICKGCNAAVEYPFSYCDACAEIRRDAPVSEIRPDWTARDAFPKRPEQTLAEVIQLYGLERKRLSDQVRKLLKERNDARTEFAQEREAMSKMTTHATKQRMQLVAAKAAGEALAAELRETQSFIVPSRKETSAALAQWEALK